MMKKANQYNSIEGKPLIVSAGIAEDYAKKVKSLQRLMYLDLLKGLSQLQQVYGQDDDNWDFPENGSLIVQFRRFIKRMYERYNPLFAVLSNKVTKRMVERINRHSASTLRMSLREIAPKMAIKTDFMTGDLKDLVQGITEENVNLIRTIPQNYLSDVQKVVTASITNGKGLADLKPFLKRYYESNQRKAELTALDQTRKAYNNINAERMKRLGVKKFKWIHSGGGREPRQLHVGMNGNIYEFDEPPYIGDMYGEKVYGLPGHLPNCRCTLAPVWDLNDNR